MAVVGNVVSGSVDGNVVGSVTDTKGTYAYGMVAVGSGWHVAYYDNFSVSATEREHT